MNKEELIGKLQMVYVGDKNALNEMIDYYAELFDEMESWREEVKELKKQLEKKNKPQIFIDTQDMEERYAEELYHDFLKEENKQLKDNWNKLKEWLKEYEEGTYGLGSYETGLSDGLGDVIKKMQEIQGSRE